MSLMTRANGHCKHLYSVAQHSINCYKEANCRGYSERVQLACLLHDASESYISGITRPVKCNLPEYNVIENRLQSCIYDRFGLNDLSAEEYKQIKEVDDTLLYFELEALMDSLIFTDRPYISMEHDFSQREFVNVEKEFISIFNRITSKQNNCTCIGIDDSKGGWVVVEV